MIGLGLAYFPIITIKDAAKTNPMQYASDAVDTAMPLSLALRPWPIF